MDNLANLRAKCNEQISKMREAIRLLEKVAEYNGETANAVRELNNRCRHISYEGQVLAVSVEPILAEIEYLREEEAIRQFEADASELFGNAHG